MWYHASPRLNRESIRQHGLLAQRLPGMHTIFAIPGQPAGLYLVKTETEADRYVWHVFERWFPNARVASNAEGYLARGARLAAFDVWSIEGDVKELQPDLDWPGQAYWTQGDIASARVTLMHQWTLKDYALNPDRFRDAAK